MTGLEAVRALTLVAGLFFLATCFPLRKLLERYVSPLAAAWGCVLFVFAPKMIRFACAPLLESSRMFFMIATILYFFRTVENQKWKNAVLFGISAALMAAARGEGIALSVTLLLGIAWGVFTYCRSWTVTSTSVMLIVMSVLSFMLGLLCEQLSQIRRKLARSTNAKDK